MITGNVPCCSSEVSADIVLRIKGVIKLFRTDGTVAEINKVRNKSQYCINIL